MNSSQKLHAHSFQLPPLQDRYQEEPAIDPSVDQDHEANEAESSARASSVPIRPPETGKCMPDPSSDDGPDSVSEEEEEEKKE